MESTKSGLSVTKEISHEVILGHTYVCNCCLRSILAGDELVKFNINEFSFLITCSLCYTDIKKALLYGEAQSTQVPTSETKGS